MCHGNATGVRVTLVMLLSLCTPWPEAVSGQDTVTPIRSTTVVDLPNDAELFAAYQRDRSNQKVQSWGQYRDWVQTFYKGNLVSEGWIKFGEVTVGKVKSAAARQTVIAQINELGRIIGLEWAKDSNVRRITTTDLRRWNDVMVTARRRDDGSGQRTIDALKAVRRLAENQR
jgi:hypothetical protein